MDRGLVVSATIAAIPRTALAIVKVQLSRVAIARFRESLDPSLRGRRKINSGS